MGFPAEKAKERERERKNEGLIGFSFVGEGGRKLWECHPVQQVIMCHCWATKKSLRSNLLEVAREKNDWKGPVPLGMAFSVGSYFVLY